MLKEPSEQAVFERPLPLYIHILERGVGILLFFFLFSDVFSWSDTSWKT